MPESAQLGTLDTADGQRFFPATFTLGNSGDATLLLEQPRTSCGCTKASLGKMELAPGESTQLSVTVDITGRYGQQRFSIFVGSNASSSPRRLSIEATIPDTRTGWVLMPALVTFREAKQLRVNVRLFDRLEGIQVTAVDLPDGCQLLTTLPAAIPPAGLVGLEIRCSPEALASGGRHKFTVHTNHPQIPQQDGTLNMSPRTETPSTTRRTAPASTPAEPPPPPTAAAPQLVAIQASVLRELLSAASDLTDLQVLDVRSASDFAAGRVPRSHSYPASRWSEQPFWPATSILVIVAADDEQAEKAAEALLKTPCRHVLVLQGGFPAWERQDPSRSSAVKK